MGLQGGLAVKPLSNHAAAWCSADSWVRPEAISEAAIDLVQSHVCPNPDALLEDEVFLPQRENQGVYRRGYEKYRELYKRLKDLMK